MTVCIESSAQLVTKMKLSKDKRQKLIAQVGKASGVAHYALEKKMTDEEVVKAAENLEVLKIIKPANDYNRYCQSQKTAEANAKLKQFLDIKNSEIYQTGQWLVNTLAKVSQTRKQSLLEKDLVHKDDYNKLVEEAAQAMDMMASKAEQQDKILSFLRQELGPYQYIRIMKKYQKNRGE